MLRFPKWSLRRWLLLLGAIIVLLLIGLRLRLRWEVHEALAELRAEGLPLNLEDLGRYYSNTSNGTNAGSKLTNILSQIRIPSAAKNHQIPIVGLAGLPPNGKAWPDPMRRATGEYLESIQSDLMALYPALTLPNCHFPMFTFGSFESFKMPVLVKSRQAILSLECLYALDQNDWLRAARANAAQFRFADTLSLEPGYTAQLIRQALAEMALDNCRLVLGYPHPDPRTPGDLKVALQQSIEHISLRCAVTGERVEFLEWTSSANGSIALIAGNTRIESGSWREKWERLKVIAYRMSGLADQDTLWYLENSRKLEALLSGTLAEQQQVVDTWATYQPAGQHLWFHYWSSYMTQVDDKVIAKHLKMHATLRAALAAVAVVQFRIQHNEDLPSNLNELVPEYLEKVPIEPKSGKPFELIKTANGFGIGRGTPVFKVHLNGVRQEAPTTE